MASVIHPRLDEAEFRALQFKAGWRLGVELIRGEAVVMPPTGGEASLVQGALFLALGRVADPERAEATVFNAAADQLVAAAPLRQEDEVRSPLLPGFVLGIGALFSAR